MNQEAQTKRSIPDMKYYSFPGYIHSFSQESRADIRFPDLKREEMNVERRDYFRGYENSKNECERRGSLEIYPRTFHAMIFCDPYALCVVHR